MLVRKLPDVVGQLVERLNNGVTLHDYDPADANCEIKMDFGMLIPPRRGMNSLAASKKKRKNNVGERSSQERRKETELLTCLIATGNKKVLAHPLSEAFLLVKWRRVRKFFLASLLFQMALVALFTIFVVEVYLIRCPYRRHQNDESSATPHSLSKREAVPVPANSDSGFDWFRVLPPKKKHMHPEYPRPDPPPPPLGRPSAPASKFPSPSTTVQPPGFYAPAIPNTNESASGFHFSVKAQETQGNGVEFEELATTPYPTASDSSSFSGNRKAISEEEETEGHECRLNWPLQIIWLSLLFFISIMCSQEVFQMVHSPSRYLISSENWAQWLLISSVLVTAWRSGIDADNGTFVLEYWQYPAAAVSKIEDQACL